MSDLSVSERRIRPIQDAVATGNWKQALQLCDKWHKKGEKSDKFLALKAYVLVNQPDQSQHDRGRADILELCGRSPAITDYEAIYQIQDALKDLSLRSTEGPKVWERAVAAKPSDKDLYMRWLNQSIADSNWLSAQKAAMGLRKAFHSERQYEFWNIMMCYLVHRDATLPEKERTLFGTLAYRLISKAADLVPKDQERLLSPGKAISTPEEISLLVQIYVSVGKAAEASELLQGDALNAKSHVGKQDPQLVLSLLLETVEASQNWDDALTLCRKLLTSPEHQSDDRIWGLLLKALAVSTSPTVHEQGREIIDTLCRRQPPNRSALLAKLKFLQRQSRNNASFDGLLRACQDYFEAFGAKPFCYDDLKDAIGQLAPDDLATFTKGAAEGDLTGWRQLFILKLTYTSLSSEPSRPSDLITFAAQAVKHYRTSLSTAAACPEAALLGVLALLRASRVAKQPDISLLATILLEICRTHSEDYYPFSVLLLQTQLNLGLVSLAMETFLRLSIKNMQWETVGHLLLMRISSLHPAQSGTGAGSFSPAGAIDAGLTMLENADQALVRGIREGLRFGGYSNIGDNVGTRVNVGRSMNRQIYATEERKISRLLGLADDTILPARPDQLVDNRDVSFLPNYCDSDPRLLASLRCGPLPQEAWLDAMALLDHVATYLKQELAALPATAGKAFESLQASKQRLEQSQDVIKDELTSAELENWECHRILADVAVLLQQGSSVRQNELDDLVTELQQWLSSQLAKSKNEAEDTRDGQTVAGIHVPTWDYLHGRYTRLETLQVLSIFLALLGKKPKSGGKKGKAITLSKEKIAEIQVLVSQAEEEIQDGVKKIKEGINAPGVLGKLVDLGLGRTVMGGSEEGNGDRDDHDTRALEQEIEELCDEASLESLCGRLKESWEDALDGVLAVRIKSFK